MAVTRGLARVWCAFVIALAMAAAGAPTTHATPRAGSPTAAVVSAGAGVGAGAGATAAAAASAPRQPTHSGLTPRGGSGRVVGYIDRMNAWWPPEKVAASLGVPGYAEPSGFTVLNLAFWLTGGPADAATVWANALTYVSPQNPWGNTTAEVQVAWLKLYHKAGIKVLVSAFGSTDMPTSQDPTTVAAALAKFVVDNQLDGADLDYEDNNAMNAGKGEAWLIACTRALRAALPAAKGYIITHAPQAPYFMGPPRYPGGGYVYVDKEVGRDIDWYNVQFYNQVSSTYSTFPELFTTSNGWANDTAVTQLMAKGVAADKIVVGKPVGPGDAANTGYVPTAALAAMIQKGVATCKWDAGVMGWQYSSDAQGAWSKAMAKALAPA